MYKRFELGNLHSYREGKDHEIQFEICKLYDISNNLDKIRDRKYF